MSSYQVGTNSPIKLKVSVETEAIPMTYTFIETTNQTGDGTPDIPPFNPSVQTGWKAINKGKPVKGKTEKVVTFLRFFNDFANEETFNLAIKQIKDTYVAQLNGGTPSPFELTTKVESQFSSKTCLITSEVDLI
ncbi:hypothetical protein [Psychroserpens sp.]|uniref:hypothetical protein n=1 Tax=Psychroserpens sp. TaxID=2020870 RepID=UPI001B047026|nr:hypothetical protein [Psychroserpens sp.]MBO6606414.1 hypothetical protein [Psychroserpens sp.]MBO6631224.1 hypothetical protein [Psychroserpens sp.]MBO6653118.1 hypothetical protein [Psychroserpens sp.]MBO6680854.1 hypothetical protein [Psychroserpens sp.]MBO6750188.1 hypothetical protein [Psychroserpens sp.]